MVKKQQSLTESELLRMPKKDYMDKKQLAFFAERLLALREEAKNDIEKAREELISKDQSSDDCDIAFDNETHFMETKIIERKSKLIIKINEALSRINHGTYGYCVETGEPIGLQRLLLRPTATLSIESKQLQEEVERIYWDEE